jgi:uncharacterized coiled-coil DUF342 family protein
MTDKTPTAKEVHAAIEGLRKKAQQLRDELEQTNAKIAALERAASAHASGTAEQRWASTRTASRSTRRSRSCRAFPILATLPTPREARFRCSRST